MLSFCFFFACKVPNPFHRRSLRQQYLLIKEINGGACCYLNSAESRLAGKQAHHTCQTVWQDSE